MPAAASKKASKPKAASSYTYTGCWTCRKRHVKCDEGKPNCARCTKAGFECQGYDFRFDGSGSSRSFRRPVAAGTQQRWDPGLTSRQVSGILDELDETSESTTKGPFSVLSFSTRKQEAPSSPSSGPPVLRRARSSSQTPSSSSFGDSGSQLSHDTQDVVRYTSAPMVQEPCLLPIVSSHSELFEHWTSFLCNYLSPLSASLSNPFRYLYPSLALEGIMAGTDAAGPRLAVWHGICGTAAWSLSKIFPENGLYRALSVKHDQLALNYIQRAIEQPGGVRDASVPAAIMTCLTGDIASGRLDLWGMHLRGGFRCLINVLQHQKLKGSTTSALCQQYLLSAALAKFGTDDELALLKGNIIPGDLYLEECHCLTQAMIDIVFAINKVVASKRAATSAVVDAIRLQLVQSVPRFDNITRHHISHAYYYAITIYFTRNVLQSGDTSALALRAIEHLEWAKDSSKTPLGQILMWMVLTVGSECSTSELQERLLAWCNSQLRVSVNNVDAFMGMLRQAFAYKPLILPNSTDLPIRELKKEEELNQFD